MTPEPNGAVPKLVESLAKVAGRHPFERKLVVAPTAAAARELLRRLSLVGDGWVGLEVTTPRPLAVRLAARVMEREELRAMDGFEEQALLDEAMDRAMASERGGLAALSDGVGFRERVHGAITAVRLAGLDARGLEKARLQSWEKKRFLLSMLRRYEQLLEERRRVDTAAILALAVEALEAEGGTPPGHLGADRVLLLPGLGTRGLTGRLVSELSARGAKVLETDAVLGLEVPGRLLWKGAKEADGLSYFHVPVELAEEAPRPVVGFFRAASVHEELREVLRRAAERGQPWDEVEIVTTDSAAYGSALHALSERLGIPVTYAVGLPLGRTRVGRVVRVYLEWIEEGFQADPIRRLLEAGDLTPRRSLRVPPAVLARAFRRLRIGWGRKRYRAQIREALQGLERSKPSRGETEEIFERRRRRRRRELEALRSILFSTLRATPAVPDRLTERGSPVSPAEIARGLRAFLRRVPTGAGPERHAREEVERILERVEATLVRRTDFTAAVTVLRRHLDVRVRAASPRAERDELTAPWASEGGHLHLSDLESGGWSGRPATYVVGLDADRLPGFEGQDPVLLDGDRRVLGKELPTSMELLREKLFRFAALLARLRGEVTLSYASWEATEARALSPSPLLLQALRFERGDESPTFEDLHRELGPAACAVPPSGRPPLDGDDVWMSALGDGAVLRTGLSAVCEAFPGLAAGVPAWAELRGGEPNTMHGVVSARPEALDPRLNPDIVLSASALEGLGTCPLRYLQAKVLRARPPDDPEFDPDRWLDALNRGSVLHAAYEATLRSARSGGVALEDDAFERLAAEVLEVEVERKRATWPVPGEGALRREKLLLHQDMRSFVRMMRERAPEWVALELTFGLRDEDPVVMELPGGPIRLRGAIDRVDGALGGDCVVDYKTGVVRDFAGNGTFHGGRRLQLAVYAHAAQELLGSTVVSGEYHFPTMRGQNRAIAFPRLALAGAPSLIDDMLDGVAAGSFVPTEEGDDCKFCDYAPTCRVGVDTYGNVSSPRAEWSRERYNTAGEASPFAHLKRARTFED